MYVHVHLNINVYHLQGPLKYHLNQSYIYRGYGRPTNYNDIMLCKSPKTSQRPQKPRQGDQLIHRCYTKSSPQLTNFSFRFGARSKSGKVKPGRQRGATVVVGDDGSRVVVQEWNRDRMS